MWIVRSSLHFLEVVCRELLFHLSHLRTERIDILVRVSLPGFEGVVFQKELLKFVGRIEVGFLLLLTGKWSSQIIGDDNGRKMLTSGWNGGTICLVSRTAQSMPLNHGCR